MLSVQLFSTDLQTLVMPELLVNKNFIEPTFFDYKA